MTKFEYRIVKTAHVNEKELNGYGESGWELAGIMQAGFRGAVLVLKRKVGGDDNISRSALLDRLKRAKDLRMRRGETEVSAGVQVIDAVIRFIEKQ